MNLKLDLNEQGHSEKVLTAVIFIFSTEVTKHIINYNHQRARRIRRRADELVRKLTIDHRLFYFQ